MRRPKPRTAVPPPASTIVDALAARAAAARTSLTIPVGSALDVFGGDIPYADVLAWQAREDAS